MDFGLAKGLAVDLQYDQRIQDARYQDQQFRRAQAENEASLKAFEDDTDYMNAANSFDQPRIKEYSNNIIKQMGAIIRENPDYKYNPDARRRLKELKVELKSNPEVIRGMASDENFKRLNDDLAKVAKNPNMYDAGKYQELLAQKQNYLKYGHQEGEEAYKKFGAQAFIYDKPDDFVNISEEGLKDGALIKARKYKDHGNGGYEELVDENALTVAAMDLYNRRKRQIQVTYNPKSDAEGIAYAKELIRPGIALARKFGVPDRNHALEVEMWKAKQAAKKGERIDSYHYDIEKAKGNKLNVDAIRNMIGTTPQVVVHNQDAHNMGLVKGKEFIPNGDYVQEPFVYQANDGKWRSDKTKTVGVIRGQVKYNEDDMDATGWLDDPSMSSKIKKAEEEDKKGKMKTVYYVDSQYTFDPQETQGFKFRYNHFVGETNKQLEGMGALDNNTNIPQYSVADLRKDSRWTEQDIQRAINEGLAR